MEVKIAQHARWNRLEIPTKNHKPHHVVVGGILPPAISKKTARWQLRKALRRVDLGENGRLKHDVELERDEVSMIVQGDRNSDPRPGFNCAGSNLDRWRHNILCTRRYDRQQIRNNRDQNKRRIFHRLDPTNLPSRKLLLRGPVVKRGANLPDSAGTAR